jgi:hypothetical protein
MEQGVKRISSTVLLCIATLVALDASARPVRGPLLDPSIFCGAIPPKLCQGLCAQNEFATTLSVTRSGEILWEDSPNAAKSLNARLDKMDVSFTYFHIKPDEQAPYGAVARLLLELQRRNFDSVLCDVPRGNELVFHRYPRH